MRNLIIGLCLGSFLTLSFTALAEQKPKITGDSGTLEGIEIVNRDNRTECKDPEYFANQKIISCY